MVQATTAKAKKPAIGADLAAARSRPWLALALLGVLGLVLYGNSFKAPFVFDGALFIEENPSIKNLAPWNWSLGRNRPVGFFTFALNYVLNEKLTDDRNGYSVGSFHAVNLAIHVAVAWLLFDIVRRTLSRGRPGERYGKHAWGLALAVAVLWLAHPLQTQSVTYLYQRLESLMALLYLATLWCFLKSLDSPRAGRWLTASVIACALGMGTKEVMVTAPLLVLWYDRVFVAGSWREIFERRRVYYGGLAATWLVLAGAMLAAGDQYEAAGLLWVKNVSPFQYACSQPGVILHYLRLTFWPDRLCLDYGWPVAESASQIVPQSLVIAVLVGLALWAMFRRPAWGFLGGCFFLILAPTSSVAPIVDLAFEHRMYLPLAAVVTLVVLAAFELLTRLWPALAGNASGTGSGRAPRGNAARLALPLAVLVLTALLGYRTLRRNDDYRDKLSIAVATVEERPDFYRPRSNLGKAYLDRRDFKAALVETNEALRLNPKFADAWFNRGLIYAHSQQYDAAIRDFTASLELHPDDVKALINRGLAYYSQGPQSCPQAIADFTAGMKTQPKLPLLYYYRGGSYAVEGKFEKAFEDFSKAVELDPKFELAKGARRKCAEELRRRGAKP